MSSQILKFLRHEIKDHTGRSFLNMIGLEDEAIERSRDVIQWMFPTDIRSKSNPNSPVLTTADIRELHTDFRARLSIQRAMWRMVHFYEKNTLFWITQNNHNFKRITRILRSLWLADLKKDYVGFQRCLDAIYTESYDIIGEETFLYWKNANDIKFLLEMEIGNARIAEREQEENDTADNLSQYL